MIFVYEKEVVKVTADFLGRFDHGIEVELLVVREGAWLSGEVQALALMGASAQAPAIGMSVSPGEELAPEVAGLVTELYSAGISLGEGGILLGEVASVGSHGEAYREFLTVSASDAQALEAFLADGALGQSHSQALSELAVSQGYAGVNLDYQGVAAPEGLAAALDQQDRGRPAAAVQDDAVHRQGRPAVEALVGPTPGRGQGISPA